MSDNPFSEGSASNEASELFTSTQVAVATFLGSPLAGTTLLVLNAGRASLPLGTALWWGGGLTAAVFLAAIVLPDWVPSVTYSLAGVFGMRAVNEALFTQALALQDSGARPSASWPLAVGVGFGWLLALLTFLGVLFLL